MPDPFLTEEKLAELERFATVALTDAIATGEVPAFLGEPMDEEDAVAFAIGFLEENRGALAGMSIGFAFNLVRRLTRNDVPLDDFERSLEELDASQLADLAERDAAEAEAEKARVIDGRRALVEKIEAAGLQLLRGALATALGALLESTPLGRPAV